MDDFRQSDELTSQIEAYEAERDFLNYMEGELYA